MNKKIIIHPITYILLFSLLLCGYFNYFLIISFILFVHDLGHVIIMWLFNIRINRVTILPFGSIINSNYQYNINSNVLFLISIAGITMQLLLYGLFKILISFNLINNLSYNIFLTYNKLIILFNILPIIPLDGSKILLSIVERFFPYKVSLIIINIVSLIAIIIFFIYNKLNFNLILMCLLLLFKTYQEILEHNFIFNKFLLERYLNNYNYYKIKSVRSINKIYKNRYNFINNQNEGKYLANLFDINNYF